MCCKCLGLFHRPISWDSCTSALRTWLSTGLRRRTHNVVWTITMPLANLHLSNPFVECWMVEILPLFGSLFFRLSAVLLLGIEYPMAFFSSWIHSILLVPCYIRAMISELDNLFRITRMLCDIHYSSLEHNSLSTWYISHPDYFLLTDTKLFQITGYVIISDLAYRYLCFW